MKQVMFALLITLLPVAASGSKDIVALVNETAITSQELELEVAAAVPRVSYHGNISDVAMDDLREQVLNGMVERELIFQYSVASGMKPDKTTVKKRMADIRDAYPSKKEFKKALQTVGLSEDQWKARIEKEVLVAQMRKKAANELPEMSDRELRDYYDKHPENFRQPEMLRLRMISVKDEEKIRDVSAKLSQGMDFADIAAKMSEDSYRIKGGDIGYIHKGRIYPALEEAAFQLQVGQVSPPIKTEGKWFMIKVEERKPERQLTFDESRGDLKKDLESKRAKEHMEKWLAGLRANANIRLVRDTKQTLSEQNTGTVKNPAILPVK